MPDDVDIPNEENEAPPRPRPRPAKSPSQRLLPAVVLTLAVVLSIVIVAVLFNRHVNRAMFGLYQREQHMESYYQGRDFSARIDLLVAQLQDLNRQLARDGLAAGAVLPHLDTFYKSWQKDIAGVGYMNQQGLLEHYRTAAGQQAETDMSFMPNVQRVLATREIVLSGSIVTSDGSHGIILHVPLFVGEEFKGTTMVTIRAATIGAWFPDFDSNQRNFTVVLDSASNVVSHPDSQFIGESVHTSPEPLFDGKPLTDDMLRDGRTGSIEGRLFRTKLQIVGMAAISLHGMRFVFLNCAPYDVIAAPVLRFSRYTSLLTGLAFLVTALGFVYALYVFHASRSAMMRQSTELRQDIRRHESSGKEREELINELEMKNAELERFAYTVSHDLKSPLITIRGFLGMLERDVAEGDEERMKSDMTRITNATENMQRLLDELLELSRVGRLDNPLEDFALSEVTEEVLELLAGRMQDREIEVVVSPDLPVVHGDRPRFREVMQNLIENALKFMGDQPEPRIEVGMRDDGGESVIFVKDNGIGLDMEYADRIFQLFEQLDPSFEGTGMGLAMVKRILEHAGSRIWAESDGLDAGTSFCFTVPPRASGNEEQ
jgi:signal transduction histidine kinase